MPSSFVPHKVISEDLLAQTARCPLSASGPVIVDPVLHCTQETLRWLLIERFDGRLPTPAATREMYD